MSCTPDLRAATWRKSSHSDGGADNCVEVAVDIPAIVPIRDSKDPHGPVVIFPADAWSCFVAAVKGGEMPGA
jgi:hypothetical protein